MSRSPKKLRRPRLAGIGRTAIMVHVQAITYTTDAQNSRTVTFEAPVREHRGSSTWRHDEQMRRHAPLQWDQAYLSRKLRTVA